MDRQNSLMRPLLLISLIACVIYIIAGWQHIITRSGWDPDDQLRLVQVRDFLNGQSWFDVTQYRLNAPQGTAMHWSRIVDVPLALIIGALTPLFGQPVAEMVAGCIVPLSCLGLVAYMLGQITTRIANIEAGHVAIVLTFLSTAMLPQFLPMRIDHHGWQIVLAVLSLWTLFWTNKKCGGIVLGLSLATWLHISLEGLPLTAAFFVLLGWRWIVEKAHGQRLIWAISAFCVGTLALFFATQAAGVNALIYCDAISPAHLAAIALATAIMLGAIVATPDKRRVRLAAAAFAGGAALGVLLLQAPQCAKGAFGTLDPLVRDYWYINVREGLPVWRQAWEEAVTLFATLLCGVMALWAMRRRSMGSVTVDLRLIGFFILYSAILSLLVFRTVAVAAAFALPVVAAWIGHLFERYRRSHKPVLRISLVALMLFLLVPAATVSQVLAAGKSILGSNVAPKQTMAVASTAQCETPTALASLSKLPKSNILAPFDMGPAILMATPHSVLASSHHRNVEGMRDQIRIFRSVPDTAKVILQSHAIGYIAVCPHETEMQIYQQRDPSGLWAGLAKGTVPAWLERLPNSKDGLMLWRVKG
jgi:hypothetical protein